MAIDQITTIKFSEIIIVPFMALLTIYGIFLRNSSNFKYE